MSYIGKRKQRIQSLPIPDLLQVLYQRNAPSLMLDAPLNKLLPRVPEPQSQQGPNLLDRILYYLGLIPVLLIVRPAEILSALTLPLPLPLGHIFLHLGRLGEDAHLGGILLGRANGVSGQVLDLFYHPLYGDEHQPLRVIGKDHGAND